MTSDARDAAAVLASARAGVRRLTQEAAAAAVAGSSTLLIDTRTEAQRRAQGELPGAIVIDRTVLEWRLDPTSGAGIPEATNDDCRSSWSAGRATARAWRLPACVRSGCGGPPT